MIVYLMNTKEPFTMSVLHMCIFIAVFPSLITELAFSQDEQAWSRRNAESKSKFLILPKSPKENDLPIWTGDGRDYFDANSMLELCKAISADKPKKIERILATDIDINEEGKSGMTVLYFAFLEGKLKAFERLLKHGASPDVPVTRELPIAPGTIGFRTRDSTVLFYSLRSDLVRTGFYDAALPFTKKPNQVDWEGNSMLHITSMRAYSDKRAGRLASVLATGIDLNLKNAAGETPLHIASRFNPVMVLELLKAGADPSIPMPGDKSLVEVLYEKSTDPDNPMNEYYDRVVIWLDEHGFRP